MAKKSAHQQVLDYLAEQYRQGVALVGADKVTAELNLSRATVNRYLALSVQNGEVIREGRGPATAYRSAHFSIEIKDVAIASDSIRGSVRVPWSESAKTLRAALEAPIGTRSPVTYQRHFVDNYIPNQSSLLPPSVADALFLKGRATGQQPAGTYARKVLEQLLIDLAWHSSRLEGNRKSLLDTQELFARGRSDGDDTDALMLLNHKDAIEFMVDAVPEYGMTVAVVRNLQGLLMQNLLANPESIGGIRKTVVNITDSVYIPAQMPSLLEEMLTLIVDKARAIKNPIEAAFFLWVNIAYLQPFEDGNKRTSRLCANLPLMLSNCAPLSFLDVDPSDYAIAVMAVYERLDVALAVELFEWTYRRSVAKYSVVLEAMGGPDPFRTKYREKIGDVVRRVVLDSALLEQVLGDYDIPAADLAIFEEVVREELHHLEAFNCARYRLALSKTEKWIENGRPM